MTRESPSAWDRTAPWGTLFTGAAAVLAWDRATKAMVLLALSEDQVIPVLGSWFRIVHVRNTGAAFGMLRGIPLALRTPFFGVMTLAAMAFVIGSYPRIPLRDWRRRLSLSLILGGALGNLWDRLTLGEVVDFLDFGIGARRWPAFNVADSAIVVGVSIWILGSMVLAGKAKAGKRRVS